MSARAVRGVKRDGRITFEQTEQSEDADGTEPPPLPPHLAGDVVALRQWASVASAELRSLKLGERHFGLQLTALGNENERLARELGAARLARSQAEEAAQLARARHAGDDTALPVLRGKLLEAARSAAATGERAREAAAREAVAAKQELAEERRRAGLQARGLKAEVTVPKL